MSSNSVGTQVLVLGSGAGGALTAAILAERGLEVLVLEEGPDLDTSGISTSSPEAIARLYRNRGLTPILGNQTIAFVEGCCVGGSTEINSAFWHRLPEECYARWRADAWVEGFSPQLLEPYFEQLEHALSVSYLGDSSPPPSSRRLRDGIENMGWQYTEVSRCQKGAATANPFAPGTKQSMQRTFLPRALAAGAQLRADSKALRLIHSGGRVSGIVVRQGHTTRTFQAEHVFVCCGPIQTAALLRRSGITRNVGNNLCIHPMIKAAALFDEEMHAHSDVLPIYQVKEFWPNLTIGGSVFTPGFLAMLLADNWPTNQHVMHDWKRMALYYAATRGTGRGTIRALPGGEDVLVRYHLSMADRDGLSRGMSHLGEVLFAAGAQAVYPSLHNQAVLKSAEQCRSFASEPAALADMSLSTVHAFSSCPMGENPDLCATDSFGKVHGFTNLYINDASLIPDSPGVNPQGTVMAIGLRNLDHFQPRPGLLRASASTQPPPTVLLTGAPGWLGSRMLTVLRDGLAAVPGWQRPDPSCRVRCLVHPAWDRSALQKAWPNLAVVSGDLTDPEAAKALCRDAAGAVLFHIAGIVHPTHGTKEHTAVNVDGTRHLLRAAMDANVRRVVAVSSNSPFGFNPNNAHRFDEASAYNPYMSYGRSKRAMEEVVNEAQATGKIETVIIRPPWFYGPQQPPRQTLFFQMIRDGRFPILGDGEQMRSMAYVDNICQGLLLAASAASANGEAYWIADERPYSINEIVRTVKEVLEQELGAVCADAQPHLPLWVGRMAQSADAVLQAAGLYQQEIHVLSEMGHSIACSIDKAKRELGYAPTIALRPGMVESVRWCIANGQRI